MTRPLLTREALERCPHWEYPSAYTPEAEPWCEGCGAFVTFTDDGETFEVDWEKTEAADRADLEAMGQTILPLE